MTVDGEWVAYIDGDGEVRTVQVFDRQGFLCPIGRGTTKLDALIDLNMELQAQKEQDDQ